MGLVSKNSRRHARALRLFSASATNAVRTSAVGHSDMTHLRNPIFHDEEKAREWFEARVWPNGPFCPHCGETEKLTRLNGQGGAKGTKARPGLIQCNSCR